MASISAGKTVWGCTKLIVLLYSTPGELRPALVQTIIEEIKDAVLPKM